MAVYKLFWDEFSSWYLETIKPEYKKPVDRVTYDATLVLFDKLLRLIHPFMPFITEEIWQMLVERKEGESIMISRMPEIRKYDRELTVRFEFIKDCISAVRTVRREKKIPNKEKLNLFIRADEKNFSREFLPVLSRLCNLSEIKFVTEKQTGAASFMVRTVEFYIPVGDKLDIDAELASIVEELDYYRGFLTSIMKKLDNGRFVKNAPTSVLELERKKKNDAESKIKSLEERLKELKK